MSFAFNFGSFHKDKLEFGRKDFRENLFKKCARNNSKSPCEMLVAVAKISRTLFPIFVQFEYRKINRDGQRWVFNVR
jgi:hypothetical protein